MLICHTLRVVLAHLALVDLHLMLQLIQLVIQLLELSKNWKWVELKPVKAALLEAFQILSLKFRNLLRN